MFPAKMGDMTVQRPYPNVRKRDGVRGYEARFPSDGKSIYLGMYETPEQARAAVLIAQAENLEVRASRYRDEAEALT